MVLLSLTEHKEAKEKGRARGERNSVGERVVLSNDFCSLFHPFN